MISGKFAISLHILTLLTKFQHEYLSSDFIASSLNLHPVLVRKEIINLKNHQLVVSKEGKNGGTMLAKAPSQINLDQVLKITLEKVSFGYSKNRPNPNCPIGKKINTQLDMLYTNLNNQISSQLMTLTLEQFSKDF
ncbi:Rrf2 family transcriptional regulator [Aquirufa nivalisilvae]|uniref:Rrf2 family transcriptional regulator n=1 Tax=Aquirufa nivalisilvae TaxID=2516557 RepID=UPI0022A9ABF6|nr:Rrf2 family transcriptional regulator [Aquirufa nivalisilvae]MCZ2481618.1 Rrf2 family transcriptional regulator [Aquirufa nivalisilvae]